MEYMKKMMKLLTWINSQLNINTEYRIIEDKYFDTYCNEKSVTFSVQRTFLFGWKYLRDADNDIICFDDIFKTKEFLVKLAGGNPSHGYKTQVYKYEQ